MRSGALALHKTLDSAAKTWSLCKHLLRGVDEHIPLRSSWQNPSRDFRKTLWGLSFCRFPRFESEGHQQLLRYFHFLSFYLCMIEDRFPFAIFKS